LLGQVLVIVEATERLFQVQIVPLVATEILCHSVSVKATDDHTPMPSIKSTKTYDSFRFAGKAAQYGKAPPNYAIEILPIGKEFLGTFCAVAWPARHHPKKKHHFIIGLFKPVEYEYAVNFLRTREDFET
jgi:hypothetical protein